MTRRSAVLAEPLDSVLLSARPGNSLGEQKKANRESPSKSGRLYVRKLGLDEAEAHGALTRWYSERRFSAGRITRKPPSWVHERGAPPEWLLGHALKDSQSRVDARGMRFVRHLVVDIDVHAEPDEHAETARAPESLEAFLSRASRKEKNASKRAARAWRLDRARPVLERLRGLVAPFGSSAFVETSPRGWHLVVLLADAVDAREAASLARGLAALAGELPATVKVEAFPRLRADGKADHCFLPLCGPNKRVGPDFVRGGGTRAAALADLLAAPGVDLAELRALLVSSPARDRARVTRSARSDRPSSSMTLGPVTS